MSSIEQQISRVPARNGFRTLYKDAGERLQVKQVRDDKGTVDSFLSKGWKEYNRASQPIEAKAFHARQTADDQIAELRRMRDELRQEAEKQEEETEEPKKRGRKPKEETAE